MAVAVGLAVLEVVHPTFSDASISQGVAAAGDTWWIALHVLLLVGYLALVVGLFRLTASREARLALVAFGVCNTAYLAVDGILVGALARTDPAAADMVWNSLAVTVLAEATGATWAAALLLVALSLRSADRMLNVGALVTWVAFAASAVVVTLSEVSRIAAIATGAWSVYRRGSRDMPVALLVFAAVLRQHVGPEAALGLLFVALAIGLFNTSPTAPPQVE